MDIFIWRDTFNTGNYTIDCQHKNLVRLINQLFTNLGESNNREKNEAVFDELCKYTIEHFSLEEQFMQENKYSKYENHKAEHDSFTERIFDLKNKLAQHNQEVVIETINFLKDWLLNHIIGSDKRFFDFVNYQKLDKY